MTDRELIDLIFADPVAAISNEELLDELVGLSGPRLTAITVGVVSATHPPHIGNTRTLMRALVAAVEEHRAQAAEQGGVNDADIAQQLALENGRALIIKDDHTQIRILRDQAIDALQNGNSGTNCSGPLCPAFFNRDAKTMVQFGFDASGKGALFELNKASMGSRLADVADWYVHQPTNANPDRLVAAEPFDKVVDYIMAERLLFPPVERILGVPSLLEDGSFTQAMTYYPTERLVFSPDKGLEDLIVPDEVKAVEVVEAMDFLLDQIKTFPFDGPASRVHAIVFGLTPYVRDKINGPVPAWLVEAPNPRTGKGKLVHTVLSDLYGTKVPSETEAESPAEQRKKITASLRAGRPVIFIDNINEKIQGGHLASAITEGTWTDRELGQSKELSFNIRNLWVFSANNPEASQELAGRMVPSRLDAGVEFPDLLEFGDSIQQPARALRERAKIVHAKLVIIRWWVQNGMPNGTHRAFGSFEEWSKVSAGILDCVLLAYEEAATQEEAAGFSILSEAFLSNRQALKERSDYDTNQKKALVAGWAHTYGEEPIKASDIVSLVNQSSTDPKAHGYEINIHFGTSNKEAANNAAKLVRSMVGRVFDGYVVREVVRSNQSRYKLERVKSE